MPRHLDRDSVADWYRKGFFYQPSCFFSERARKKAGCLDEGLDMALDLDWWLRLAAVGRFASTTEMLSAAKIHGAAKTQARRREMEIETIMVQIRHGYTEIARDRIARLLNQPSLLARASNVLKVTLVRSALHGVWCRLRGRPSEYLQTVLERRSA